MKINHTTHVDVLNRRGIIGFPAYKICRQLHLNTVEDILKTKVSHIDRSFTCNKNTLLDFCVVHKAFHEGTETRKISDFITIRKVSDDEKKEMVSDYADHVPSNFGGEIKTQDTKTNTVEILNRNFDSVCESFGQHVASLFNTEYPSMSEFYDVIKKEKVCPLKDMLKTTGADKIMLRHLSRELIRETLLDEGLDYVEMKELTHILDNITKWSDYHDALDLYASFDDESRNNLILNRDECIAGHSWEARKEHYDVKRIVSDLEYIYGPKKYSRIARDSRWYSNFLDDFKKVFEKQVRDMQSKSNDPSQLMLLGDMLAKKHPYLTDEERDHILAKVKAGDGLPWLYMYVRHFLRDDDRNSSIKRDFYGFNAENRNFSMDELRLKYGLQKERIRMILHKPHLYQFPGNDSLIEYLNLENLVGEDSPKISDMIRDNELDMSPSQLLELFRSIYRGSETLTMPNGRKYFIKGYFIHNNRFQGLYTDIQKALAAGRKEPCALYYERTMFLGSRMDADERKTMAKLASKVFEDAFGLDERFNIVEPLNYTILPNMINREDVIRQILEKAGVPMTGKEIMEEYRRLCPEDNLPSFATFKSLIQKTESVVSKGRTGFYVLDSWDGHYTGTITDFLLEILTESKTPLTVEELADKAKLHFPTTGNRSVEILLKREVPNRFLAFEVGIYGSSQRKYPKKYKILA